MLFVAVVAAPITLAWDTTGDELVIVSVKVLVLPTATLPNVTELLANARVGVAEEPGVLMPEHPVIAATASNVMPNVALSRRPNSCTLRPRRAVSDRRNLRNHSRRANEIFTGFGGMQNDCGLQAVLKAGHGSTCRAGTSGTLGGVHSHTVPLPLSGKRRQTRLPICLHPQTRVQHGNYRRLTPKRACYLGVGANAPPSALRFRAVR
jgi:hypothetical protein